MGMDYRRGFEPEPQSENANSQQEARYSQQRETNYNQQSYTQGPQPHPNYDPHYNLHVHGASYERKPNSWLVWAILSTIFCCLPFGIVAIVYASKVDNLWYMGRVYEAESAAKTAKTWTLVSIISGVVIMLIYAAYLLFLLYILEDTGSLDELYY